MAKRRMCKADKWMVALSELSARYGVALMEIYDGARLKDKKSEKELGRSLAYVCGLYTAHKPRTGKTKQCEPLQRAGDVQGFLRELNKLSDNVGVRLELRAAPMMLIDVGTMEPLGRLTNKGAGYAVNELQPVK